MKTIRTLLLAVLCACLAACSAGLDRSDMARPVVSASRGGARVSPYHSDGQWVEFRMNGPEGVYRRYVEPLELRPGQQLVWCYPFTDRGHAYQLRQNRTDPALQRIVDRLLARGVEPVFYLPAPSTSDTWDKPTTEAKVAEIRRLIQCVPAGASICFDIINSSSPEGRIAIDLEREAGRRIYGEPMAFTYNAWGQRFTYFENSEHFARHRTNPTRVWQTRHYVMLHEDIYPPGWDIAACTLDWTRLIESFGPGFRWVVQAEPLVNAPVRVTMDQVDPARNRRAR